MKFNASQYNQHWQNKTLNDLGKFQRGKSRHRPRNDMVLFEGGIHPLVQTGDIKEANLYVKKHVTTYNDFGLAQSKMWPKDTLCITIAANIAETALLGYPMCFPDSVVGFNAYSEESSELFMHYIFTYIKRAIQNSASGSIQDNINIEYLTSLEFKIPPKEYQDKIVAVLYALDAKIECNNRINAKLETMAKTLYDYWFVQFDFPDENGKPYKSSGGKMVLSPELKREIPEEWEVKKIAELIFSEKSGDWGDEYLQDGHTKKVTCIRGADINGLNGLGECKPPVRYILEKNSYKILNPNDLIIEISGGSPKQSTGRMAYLTSATLNRFDSPLICSNFCKSISLKNNRMLYNFACHWNNLYESGAFFGYEGKTSGLKNLLFDSFVNSHYIIVPKDAHIGKFYQLMQRFQEKKQLNLIENKIIINLRNWLLPVLMNGQIKVV